MKMCYNIGKEMNNIALHLYVYGKHCNNIKLIITAMSMLSYCNSK